MPIRVTCQGCATPYTVGENMAGKRVKCKRCGNMFEVPRADAPASPHIEDIIAQEAPAVGFKEEEDKIFKKPTPETPLPENAGQALNAKVYDDLEVAASTEPKTEEDDSATTVGRPDADSTPTGKKRLMKLRPGARSYSDRAKLGEIAATRMAQKDKEELAARIEMRTVFSDFRKNPLSKVVIGFGIGAFVIYHVWMAIHLSDWMVLRNMGIRMAVYAAVSIPFGMLGVYLTALAMQFKPTQPLVFVVGVTAAAPAGILALGYLTEDTTWIVVAAVAAFGLTYWVFHVAFQQGLNRNLAAFFGMLVLPLLVAWVGSMHDGFKTIREEYLSDAPRATMARAAEKDKPARPAAPTTIPHKPGTTGPK